MGRIFSRVDPQTLQQHEQFGSSTACVKVSHCSRLPSVSRSVRILYSDSSKHQAKDVGIRIFGSSLPDILYCNPLQRVIFFHLLFISLLFSEKSTRLEHRQKRHPVPCTVRNLVRLCITVVCGNRTTCFAAEKPVWCATLSQFDFIFQSG